MSDELLNSAPPLGESSTANTPAPATADATPAASDSTPDTPLGMHRMTKGERKEFLKTGKAPATRPDAAADSSTAKPGDTQAPETAGKDKAPASEPGKPAHDRRQARNSEDSRIPELLTDRQRERERADRAERDRDELRKRLDALEGKAPKTDVKADSSTAAPATAEPAYKKYRGMPDAPKAGDFDDIEDYVAAMGVFVGEKIAEEKASAVFDKRQETSAQEQRRIQEIDQVISRAAERLAAEEAADPTLKEKIHPGLRDLVPARLLPSDVEPAVEHYIKDVITFESETPQALHAFYSSPEGQAEWNAMRKMSAREIDRTVTIREQLLKSAKPAQGKPATAPKTFTRTPPPPADPGKTGAGVVDPSEAAVKAGNFRAFKAAEDAKEGFTPRYGRRSQ